MLGLWQAERTYPEVLSAQLQSRIVTPADLRERRRRRRRRERRGRRKRRRGRRRSWKSGLLCKSPQFLLLTTNVTFFFPKSFELNKTCQLATDIT